MNSRGKRTQRRAAERAEFNKRQRELREIQKSYRAKTKKNRRTEQ